MRKRIQLKAGVMGAVLLLSLLLAPVATTQASSNPPSKTIRLNDESVQQPLPPSGLPVLPAYEDDSISLQRGSFPARYDSRQQGIITSVKDQGAYGACWAFGAAATGETSMLKKGLAKNTVDLSELHLSYFNYYPTADPLGLTKGDTVRSTTGRAIDYLQLGGNNLFSMFTLAKWTGVADESVAPYGGKPSYLNASLAYKDVAHMQNARFVNNSDREQVKRLITQYGAVSTSLFFHPDFGKSNGAFYTPATYNKIVASSPSSNHVVTIVGWDDNYSKNNFTMVLDQKTFRPNNNGAWIVKNSYGTSYGDSGYNYISYEDYSYFKPRQDFLCYAFEMESASNYNYNYQYDGSPSPASFRLKSGDSIANRYTVRGNSGKNESIDAISFAPLTANVNYSIQLYKNPSSDDPTSGSPMLKNAVTGTTSYGGYYTIPINEKPVLKKGDSFSVVIRLSTKNNSTLETFIDYTSTMSNAGLTFVSSTSTGMSYYKSGSNWTDFARAPFTNYSATARVKAFTTATTSGPTPVYEPPAPTFSTPALSGTSAPNYNTVNLKWKRIANATGYEIFFSTSRNGSYRRATSTTKLSYTHRGRLTGTTYYYKMRAYRKMNGRTYYSRFSSVRSAKPSLRTSSITRIRATGNKRVQLKWRKITGASGYEIYRATTKKGKYTRVKSIASSRTVSYTNKLKKKRTYYYKVRAYRKVKGKKAYGKFSSPKKVRVK